MTDNINKTPDNENLDLDQLKNVSGGNFVIVGGNNKKEITPNVPLEDALQYAQEQGISTDKKLKTLP
ncbi:MAG: hypothetical protein IKG98_06835 [Ruminococcus sp.]|nr:hypothetical protein [Ruminococcus sp.]